MRRHHVLMRRYDEYRSCKVQRTTGASVQSAAPAGLGGTVVVSGSAATATATSETSTPVINLRKQLRTSDAHIMDTAHSSHATHPNRRTMLAIGHSRSGSRRPIDPAERAVLLDLWVSTGGADGLWYYDALWNSTAWDACGDGLGGSGAWCVVQGCADGHEPGSGGWSHGTELSIPRNTLTGTIPDCIGALSALTRLVLRYNRLRGSAPDGIPR